MWGTRRPKISRQCSDSMGSTSGNCNLPACDQPVNTNFKRKLQGLASMGSMGSGGVVSACQMGSTFCVRSYQPVNSNQNIKVKILEASSAWVWWVLRQGIAICQPMNSKFQNWSRDVNSIFSKCVFLRWVLHLGDGIFQPMNWNFQEQKKKD